MGLSVVLLAAMLQPGAPHETVCYRSAGEAATQTGVLAQDGFRLVESHRDPLQGTMWATVRSCRFPERPEVVVLLEPTSQMNPTQAARRSTVSLRPIVLAGQRVRIIYHDTTLQLEVGGVAEASGSVGDRIKVRLANSAEERYATGVVMSAGLLEMQP